MHAHAWALPFPLSVAPLSLCHKHDYTKKAREQSGISASMPLGYQVSWESPSPSVVLSHKDWQDLHSVRTATLQFLIYDQFEHMKLINKLIKPCNCPVIRPRLVEM